MGMTQMNFEFSDDSLEFRDAARRLLSEQCSPAAVSRASNPIIAVTNTAISAIRPTCGPVI